MKILKRIIWVILIMICIPLAIYNMTILIKTKIHPEQTADFLGFKVFVVQSGSMVPNIQINDLIVVKEVSEKELKENDVITFHDGDDIVTHRIVKIELQNGIKHYITKGDNNNTNDSGSRVYSDIEGRVVFTFSKGGHFLSLFQGPTSMIMLVIMIFMAFLLNDRRD